MLASECVKYWVALKEHQDTNRSVKLCFSIWKSMLHAQLKSFVLLSWYKTESFSQITVSMQTYSVYLKCLDQLQERFIHVIKYV